MIRWLTPLALTLTLLLAAPAHAQPPGEETPGEEKSEGRPLDGYLATLCLVGGVLFVIGKSARR